MNMGNIAKEYTLLSLTEEEIDWYKIEDMPSFLFGVYYDSSMQYYRRMPQEIANTVSGQVARLSCNTAGGRLRFSTDSPFLVLECVEDEISPLYRMPTLARCGFGLYANNKYIGPMASDWNSACSAYAVKEGKKAFEAIRELPDGDSEIELYFPLHNSVRDLYIGIKKGCIFKEAKPYRYKKPIVFYGSSITQGECASQPGNTYQGHLCRWLSCDFINLGFSAGALAEKPMVEYLSLLDASIFVLDYDHNAQSVEYLRKTHYDLYKTIRQKQKSVPIVLISRPNETNCPIERREVIYDTYQRAKKEGDNYIWFIDGQSLFGEKDRDACTMDLVHPNDLGFYRMASAIYPILREILNTL